MNDYNKYVTTVNKIYELAYKMKNNWDDADNLSYIEEIEDNKSIIISNAKLFKILNKQKATQQSVEKNEVV